MKNNRIDAESKPLEQVHSLFQITERDNHILLTGDMELHFINMAQFVKDNPDRDHLPDMFSKWLSVITHEKADNKNFLDRLCAEEEEIHMAIEALTRFSEDQLSRLNYEKRQDAIYFEQIGQQARLRAEEGMKIAKSEARKAEEGMRIAESEARKAERSIINAVRNLQDKNISNTEIAELFQITEDELERLLSLMDG